MEYKICPTCGTVNNSSEMMCSRCLADISAVMPETKAALKNEEKIFICHENEKIEIKSGDIIGRENKWGEYLAKFMTVSRKHILFFKEDNKWYVEDAGSTNGTYINSIDIKGKGKMEIKMGDKISLSKSFTLEINGG